MNVTISSTRIQELKRLDEDTCFHDVKGDGVCTADYSGSNVDDAFCLGENAGKIILARDILSERD